MIRRAFDLGITHFDLANNYGPHYGTAERNFGTILREDLLGKYLDGAKPTGSRADSLLPEHLTEDNRSRIRSLADIADRRGQSLAQLALAWALRDERVTSLVVGASSVRQIENSIGALDRLDLSDDELAEIDSFAVEGGVDLWRGPASA